MGMGANSRPPMLLAAAAVLLAEALALLAYTVITVIAVATDQAYTVSNGVAQIILQLIMLTGVALLASGVARMRPWTRTPSVMVQILIGFVAIVLLQSHRYDWGVPTLLLAAAGLIGLLTPASLKALARPVPQPEQSPREQSSSMQSRPEQSRPQRSRQDRQPQRARKTGASGKSGNPAKRNSANPAGKPVSRRS
jgi:4-amino-4-deoxy-L-arabinose transferase-like glycosyltransferase